jgi:hypothetical protein
MLLREHRMALPNDPELLDELATVRLETTSLGGLRLNHDAWQHDDWAMSLGLAALALVENPTSDLGSISVPQGRIVRGALGAFTGSRYSDPSTRTPCAASTAGEVE